MPQISLLGGMQILWSVWDAINSCTIIDFFSKYEIPSENPERAVVDEDDLFKEPQNEIDFLGGSHPDVFSDKTITKDFVDVDDKVLTTVPFTDEEVLADLSKCQVEQDNSDNDKDDNDAID